MQQKIAKNLFENLDIKVLHFQNLNEMEGI